MSKRLQVLLPDSELEELREIAHRHKLTVGAWVREVLRSARAEQPTLAAASKLRAVRRATEHAFPAGDIRTMLDEIERGYGA
jgi:predicted DNA-binding ribbon-helix-helix protein